MLIADPVQEAVLAYLASPAAHDGVTPSRIDTHTASVFLARDRALKIKRAVRYPYLDFTTLERRHAACLAELDANRPFADHLYRGVVAITQTPDGRFAIDGDGPAVEYAVAMRRFDETRTLDRLADAGPLPDTLADRLGHVVAVAHARTPEADGAAWLTQIDHAIAQNDADLRALPALFPTDDVDRLTFATTHALGRLAPLLYRRAEEGLVRRGHGDLHLGNIALVDDVPVPFDALEFDARMACGDLIYDLAFLLMDLIERKQMRAANRVLNRYLGETQRPSDLDALAALPLFIALRAAIRAKVTAARCAFAPAAAQPALEDAARQYFALAHEALHPPAAAIIAIGGLSGTGKSMLARDLAPLLAPALSPLPGAVVLRTDAERKAYFGVGETDRLPASAYTPEINARIYARMTEKARHIAAAGHAVIVDAVFARADERDALAALAADLELPFHGLMLEATLALRLARIAARTNDTSDANDEVARQQEKYHREASTWTLIDAGGSPADTLARAVAALGLG